MDVNISKEQMYQILVQGFAATGRNLSKAEQEKLRQIVEKESSGILNWMLEGAKRAAGRQQ